MFLALGRMGSHTMSKTEPAELDICNIQRTSEDPCPELVMLYFSQCEGSMVPITLV